VRIALSLRNAMKRGQLPDDLDPERAAVAMHAYIDGILYQWLLAPDSFALADDAARWVEIGLDMLHLSPSLRK
jgi:TetR/AcrR family acrAB operon transcriptional repressor